LRQVGFAACVHHEGLLRTLASTGSILSRLAPSGGIAGQRCIKVGNMEPACCEWNHGGNSADMLFLSACR